jgi:CheY-like chemotaxis protein
MTESTSPRILVCDDSRLERSPLVQVLQRRGYLVEEADDGETALDILKGMDVKVTAPEVMTRRPSVGVHVEELERVESQGALGDIRRIVAGLVPIRPLETAPEASPVFAVPSAGRQATARTSRPPGGPQRPARRSGSRKGSGRSSTALTTLKMAVFAPMPSANVRMTTPVNPRFAKSIRRP